MGCTPTKKSAESPSPLLKSSFSSDFLAKFFTSLKDPTLASLNSETRCRKFKIHEPESKVFLVNLDSLFDVSVFGNPHLPVAMKAIIKDYKDYMSCEGFFFTNLHSVCIPNYNVEIGFTVAAIVLIANQTRFEMKVQSPFFVGNQESETQQGLMSSWVEFVNTQNRIYEDYQRKIFMNEHIAKTEVIVRKFESLGDKNVVKRTKYMKELVLIVKGFISTLKENAFRIRCFIDLFNKEKEKFEELGEMAKENNILTCEKLVHIVFPSLEKLSTA
jgi:hypothetical protein